jgi:hypothetical protein
MSEGTYHNNTPGLHGISEQHYEKIFKLYMDGEYPTYNLLQQIVLPDNINQTMLRTIDVPPGTPYSILSYNIYGNIHMWWLICLVNRIDDPTSLPPAGTKLSIIPSEHVGQVLSIIASQLPK